jgi:hypothetical protein
MRSQLLRAVAFVAIMVTAAFATTPPAAADPYWQTFVRDRDWTCEPDQKPMPDVIVRTCLIRDEGDVRPVVVINNRTAGAISIAAPHVQLYSWQTGIIYDRSCLPSTLNAGYARACFGPWTLRACQDIKTVTLVYVNWAEIRSETDYMPAGGCYRD